MKCKRKRADFGAVAAIISAIATAAATGAQLHSKAVINSNAERERMYNTLSLNDKSSSLFSNNLQSFYSNQEAVDARKNSLILPTLNDSKFKCGGKRYYNRLPKACFGKIKR